VCVCVCVCVGGKKQGELNKDIFKEKSGVTQ
jgi:hypothetical protein